MHHDNLERRWGHKVLQKMGVFKQWEWATWERCLEVLDLIIEAAGRVAIGQAVGMNIAGALLGSPEADHRGNREGCNWRK